MGMQPNNMIKKNVMIIHPISWESTHDVRLNGEVMSEILTSQIGE